MTPARTRTMPRRLAPAVTLACVVWLAGCGEDEPAETAGQAEETASGAETSTDMETSSGMETSVSPEDIDDGVGEDVDPVQEALTVLGNPSAVVGEDVTFAATVDEVITPNLLTVASSDAAQQPLVVVHPGTTDLALEEGMVVELTGEVREGLEANEVEAFLGTDIDDQVFAEWAGEYYVEATELVEPMG